MNQHIVDAKDVVQGTVGAAGATFPFWNETVAWATGINQFAVAILGLIVLGLTIYSLVLKIRIQHRQIKGGGD